MPALNSVHAMLIGGILFALVLAWLLGSPKKGSR
jgi:hypothetical protein